MRFSDLQDLSDQAALYGYLTQTLMADHLEERLGRHRFDVDMHQRRLSFLSDEHDGRIDTTLSFVASLAPGPRSMLWGWAHPQYDDGYAARLRAHGEEHGIASLTATEVPFETDATGPDLADEIAMAAHLVGQTAIHVTGDAPYYSAPAGNGTRIVVMLSGHEFPKPRIDHTAPLRVPQAFTSGLISDHRRAFHGLAVLAGWQISWADDWSSTELLDPVTGGTLTASFDERARFSNLRARLGG